MIAWIVGASGTWGGTMASELLEHGYDLVALGRTDVPALQARAGQLGKRWSFLALDLTSDSVGAVVEEALAGGVPDVVLICSAATGSDRETLCRVNYLAPVVIIERASRAMAEAGRGRIGVFLGQNARLGMAGVGEFSASQGALWTWCEAFQAELAASARGVTLTRVIPPRAASGTQAWLVERSGHTASLHAPAARPLLNGLLAGKRRIGRRPVLAALAMLVR
jgi:short-subunit dehydrogenase